MCACRKGFRIQGFVADSCCISAILTEKSTFVLSDGWVFSRVAFVIWSE